MPFLCLLVLLGLTSPLFAAPPAKPTPPPKAEAVEPEPILHAAVPAPAFMDVVSFEYRFEGQNEKVVVTSTPGVQRIDAPDDGYSILYDPQTQQYTGLEHRNYTWWEFSWSQVRGAVETSKRYEKHLQDLGNQGLTPDDTTTTPATNAPAPVTPGGVGDDSGYVWKPTRETRRISDLDCVKWTGESVSGQSFEAWCTTTPEPKVAAAMAVLRTINEPMALVPIRQMAPDAVFPVFNALAKGGVTPVLITWGDEHNKNHFRFIEAKTREGQAKLLSVPKLYVKTTLVTMDGMIDTQPSPYPRGTPGAPRVDHSNPNPGGPPVMGQ